MLQNVVTKKVLLQQKNTRQTSILETSAVACRMAEMSACYCCDGAFVIPTASCQAKL
jgi:hypothetical protein